MRVNSELIDHGVGEILSFDVAVPSNAVFVEIYRLNASQNQLIGTIVIPADILSEEVYYIPKQAIRGSAKLVKKQLYDLIAKYRNEFTNKQFDSAQKTLVDKVIPLVNNSLIDGFTPTSILDIGKSTFTSVITTSWLRLQALPTDTKPDNSLVRLNLLNDSMVNNKSKLEIVALRAPSNKEYEFSFDAWFDGVKVRIRIENGKILVDSPRLIQGRHQWNVQVYVINSRIDKSFRLTIDKYKNDRFKLEKELEFETDPELKDEILSKIRKINDKILKIETKRDGSRTNIGNFAELRFEVL